MTRKLSTRRLALAVMLFSLGLLSSGCSALRLGYEALPTVTRWQIDRHLGLDAEQSTLVARHLDELQHWHRRYELPVNAAALAAIERDFRTPVQPETVVSWRAAVFAAWAPLAERIAPALAELALTLRPDQLAVLANRFEQGNSEFRDEVLGGSAARQAERRGERMVRRAERFLGNLSDAQERDVRRWAAALPAVEVDWLAERRSRQERLLALLESIVAERPGREEALRRTRAVLVEIWVSADPGRRSRMTAASIASDALWARILNAATPLQIAALREKARGYVEDFRSLSARTGERPNS